ncbi:MAG: DUF1289 domain-containing protein [Paracoccaceae bacterium]
MNIASPCVGTCKLDDATGWCFGCARTGDEIADWRLRSEAERMSVWEELPGRFAKLGLACRRLPWTTEDIRKFVVESLSRASGTWVVGVVGAVAEFKAKPGETVELRREGTQVVALTDGGALRFDIDDDLRALTFDTADTPPARQRVVLAVKRERGRVSVTNNIADLGHDIGAVSTADRQKHLFDLGLDRKEARFCVRVEPGAVRDALTSVAGHSLSAALPQIGPDLLRESPIRVVESALGRIEVSTPIPAPGGASPAGPHTHLLPDHLATGRALPAGMDLPRAYLPGAIYYPTT